MPYTVGRISIGEFVLDARTRLINFPTGYVLEITVDEENLNSITCLSFDEETVMTFACEIQRGEETLQHYVTTTGFISLLFGILRYYQEVGADILIFTIQKREE